MADYAFTLCPEFAFVRTIRWPSVSTPADSYVMVRAVDERPTRVWTLTWEDADVGVVHYIDRLYRQTSGGVLPMDYQPPEEGSPIEVVFHDAELTHAYSGARKVGVTINLREVF